MQVKEGTRRQEAHEARSAQTWAAWDSWCYSRNTRKNHDAEGSKERTFELVRPALAQWSTQARKVHEWQVQGLSEWQQSHVGTWTGCSRFVAQCQQQDITGCVKTMDNPQLCANSVSRPGFATIHLVSRPKVQPNSQSNCLLRREEAGILACHVSNRRQKHLVIILVRI